MVSLIKPEEEYDREVLAAVSYLREDAQQAVHKQFDSTPENS